VPGEFYFMAIGGLGVTLAGFAWLIAALEGRQGERRSPITAWRIRKERSGLAAGVCTRLPASARFVLRMMEATTGIEPV
jgi:hypothetical protein